MTFGCDTRMRSCSNFAQRATEAEPLLLLLICLSRARASSQLRADRIESVDRQAAHAGKRVLDLPTGRQSSTGLLKQATLVPVTPVARRKGRRGNAQCNRDSPD